MEPSNSLDSEENDPTYECEEVHHENEQIVAKEEVTICQPVKAARKRNKPFEKRTYQKAFTMRMSMRSFSSLVAQLNEAQAEAVKSMGFTSIVKVDVKQIPRKFSKWLVESFDRYAFPVTSFDVHVTLVVPLGGIEITEITKSLMDDKYDEVHATWLKEWKL
ncbi:hypothetical protein Cgig2_005925 [Carnegiea gigantea]|uniref:Uncharacterized protein n=1 Tax=Carnegiea gigantea TaxID=171969 RepID=A0A9Q1JVD8_9CARY|nr:hypothetical protein Cgig2_005925 [Carnegiea gigantea]